MTAPTDDRRASERLDVADAGVGHRFGHFRRSFVHAVAFVLALGMFLYAANVIDPGQSSAHEDDPGAKPHPLRNPQAPESSGSLGTLSSPQYVVEIHATSEGPRYTVRDANGVVLGAMLEAVEVEQVAPGLEIEGMVGQPIMLAEPRDQLHD
ncbi:MAG: hypothetical protein H6814_09265 [Phycisphaeraceae bacterium]|nr:hypothetical protein [Phycisphaeraceae bacterium]